MKKKLAVLLFTAIIFVGFAKQDPTYAEYQPPKITSIQPVNFVAISE